MISLIAKELRLSFRHGAESMAALLFFIIAGTLFAFGVGPDPSILSRIAPSVVWVTALLAALLPLDRLFGPDFEDGTLDLLLLSGKPAYEIAAAKAASHWLTTGLPLLIMAAPLAVMLRLPGDRLPVLLLTLLPGTLIFSLLGTMAAALTTGARRGAILMPLITLPLMIPSLIFGTAAATSPHPAPPFYMIFAMLLAALPLAPLGTGLALRAAAE
ncbi:heme exporter protein CcmB [Acidocella aminolytica]|jgi:heme exporter protein B|uniref:Heme exporter protein B n=1 Tax=Acidocella aminolytica 101 = DSM 11237 TaxID=1120923 RepID=A0A0D6PHA7_9PROT|nr:heme exporter protein CcmB [Acidocella aminolytica]GAN80751.1 heme exporter protein B [Acidocella aminolytica 101 = DSM 11237]GBQ33150.1 heme exporter protein B [Acidocella aminolytica 101 = DSM 11237]SHF00253.1 heme exporter protein B [Acidocella aminolytica 101 = DSM 11237]